MAKAMDDAFLALYQNGERLRPENGYPVRLFLPGYEGNMNVKWLRQLKVMPTPAMTKDETSKYTDLQADGKALMFTFPMAVKSVITRPSLVSPCRAPASTRSRASPGPVMALSRRWKCRPMVGGPGQRRRCPPPCCPGR
jgi:DMSO/TMAO reductase YedYZ molybdopterin-dependent catalytic subunit